MLSCRCPMSVNWTSRWSTFTRNFTSQNNICTAKYSRGPLCISVQSMLDVLWGIASFWSNGKGTGWQKSGRRARPSGSRRRRLGAFPICGGALGMQRGRSSSKSKRCSIPRSTCPSMISGSVLRPCPRWVGVRFKRPSNAKKPKAQAQSDCCNWNPTPALPMRLPFM